jgi:hypothetical protein
MSKPTWLVSGLVIVCLASCVQSVSAQKLEATVLYRQDSDINYRAVIPGYSSVTAETSEACSLDPNPAVCSPNTNQSASAADNVYTVVGTTVSLLLPDGRVALINCVNKYSAKGNYINRRSCGMPLVEHVQAEFLGRSARLKWPIGPDGKKTESETYKVVALLDKR